VARSISCPFCGSRQIRATLEAPESTNYHCDKCGKEWVTTEANLGPPPERSEQENTPQHPVC
jgi:DNA-directed RNA polymerase subunit RPC12/RpoP